MSPGLLKNGPLLKGYSPGTRFEVPHISHFILHVQQKRAGKIKGEKEMITRIPLCGLCTVFEMPLPPSPTPLLQHWHVIPRACNIYLLSLAYKTAFEQQKQDISFFFHACVNSSILVPRGRRFLVTWSWSRGLRNEVALVRYKLSRVALGTRMK